MMNIKLSNRFDITAEDSLVLEMEKKFIILLRYTSFTGRYNTGWVNWIRWHIGPEASNEVGIFFANGFN